MKVRTLIVAWIVLAVGALVSPALGHCDTLDGPVAKAGRTALEKGDLTPALRWVKPEGEKELRAAFDKARVVRGLGQDARDLADTYFLETLVRVHRAGEGEPYTGLKPADQVAPGIALADKAVESGDVDTLTRQVCAEVTEGIRARLADVITKKKHAEESVEAGRAYVAAYVTFIHYVESLVAGGESAHASAEPPADAHHH